MAEYIERETAVRAVMAAKWVDGSDGAMAMEIVASPAAADVAPVRHAFWDKIGADRRGRGGILRCAGADGCGKTYPYTCDYCPNCGARMDGARNGEEED